MIDLRQYELVREVILDELAAAPDGVLLRQLPATPENDGSPDSRTPETRVEAADSGRWS